METIRRRYSGKGQIRTHSNTHRPPQHVSDVLIVTKPTVSSSLLHLKSGDLPRSYEEVNWDRKLPRRLKAPDFTLEKMADAVRKPSSRRYYERPQLWQVQRSHT
ncbi:hypothetical protein WMY93_018252 [Mugilogobius chulae]|uniref:Uncharacterized protein n=1 Tax=Mugilogobius chulae TaxID=88201 RepID=A0AAW0NJK7_9GOBI